MAEKFVKLLSNGKTKPIAIDPAQIDHNSLSNLTVGDVHTQYVKAPGTVTDNAIVRYNSTTGKLIKNSLALVDNNGGVIAADLIRPGGTSDTTNGNIRFSNSEIQSRESGIWKVLSITPVYVTATSDTSTTSGTYTTISSMTQTPSVGTYFVLFTCTASLSGNSTAEIALFIDGVEETSSTKTLAISTTALLATASFECSISILSNAVVNGSQIIDVRFRENSSGTLTIGPRRLGVFPIYR